MIYAGVFLTMIVLDAVWAKYIAAAATGTPLRAAAWSIPVAVLGGLQAIAYVHDPMTLAAAGAGAFVGTYLTKRFL